MNTNSGSCGFFYAKGKIRRPLINSKHSMKMINFRKNANCPSSQDLLAFQSSQNSTETGNQIKEHLMMCEFCVAEIELYAYCPQDEEKIKSEEIPLPLYELAEALLKRKCRDFSFLDKIFNKNPELELKKA